jgi:hypothetical protein
MFTQVSKQPKDLTALQSKQLRHIVNSYSSSLEIEKKIEPQKIFVAHGHHHVGFPPPVGTNDKVPSQLCGGVSSLYCGVDSS